MLNNSNPWLSTPPPAEPASHAGYSNGCLVHRKIQVIKHDPSKYRQKPYKAPAASQMITLGGSINLDPRPPADKRSAMRKAAI